MALVYRALVLCASPQLAYLCYLTVRSCTQSLIYSVSVWLHNRCCANTFCIVWQSPAAVSQSAPEFVCCGIGCCRIAQMRQEWIVPPPPTKTLRFQSRLVHGVGLTAHQQIVHTVIHNLWDGNWRAVSSAYWIRIYFPVTPRHDYIYPRSSSISSITVNAQSGMTISVWYQHHSSHRGWLSMCFSFFFIGLSPLFVYYYRVLLRNTKKRVAFFFWMSDLTR